MFCNSIAVFGGYPEDVMMFYCVEVVENVCDSRWEILEKWQPEQHSTWTDRLSALGFRVVTSAGLSAKYL